VKTGLNQVRHQFDELKGELVGKMAGIFGAAGFLEGIASVVEKGSQITDLGERFGIASEGLQRIGNVAKQNGSDLEAVAAGMNKLVIAQDKVRQGDEAASKSLKALGIDAKEFINLDAEAAFYRIADGVKNAEDRTAAYAAVIALMGRSSGGLVTTLEMGGDAIKALGDSMGVMSKATTDKLDDIGDAYDKLKTKLVNNFAPAIVGAINLIRSAYNTFEHLGETLGDAMFNGGANKDAIAEDFRKQQDEIWNPKPREKKEGGPRDLEETEKAASEREASAGKLQQLEEKLAALQQDIVNDGIEGETKINSLIAERAGVLSKINYVQKDAAQSNLEAEIKATELERKIYAERKKADEEHERLAAQQAKLEGKIQDDQDALDEDGPKRAAGKTIADSATRSGLGANAMYVRAGDSGERSAKSLGKIEKDMAESKAALEVIKQKQALWNP
jgi:hypothetical protein